MREFVPAANQSSVTAVMVAALTGEETSNFELAMKIRTHDAPFTMLLNATSRRDATGRVVGMVGICQDISARK